MLNFPFFYLSFIHWASPELNALIFHARAHTHTLFFQKKYKSLRREKQKSSLTGLKIWSVIIELHFILNNFLLDVCTKMTSINKKDHLKIA